MLRNAVLASLLAVVPARAQRVVAPSVVPVLPSAGIPSVSPLSLPAGVPAHAVPMLALPLPGPGLPAPSVPAVRAAAMPVARAFAAPAAAAAAVRPEDGLRGTPKTRAWAVVPKGLASLGRASLSALQNILAKAFDGAAPHSGSPVPADPRPAPTPEDPAESVTFNGLSLPRRAFSDESRISLGIVAVIGAAKDSLDIAIHGLALRGVAEALSEAKRRGVRVRIVMNEAHVHPRRRGERRQPEVQRLLDEGFEMRTLRGSREYGVMHNKFMVADGRLLMAGSFNWTHAADTMHLENVFFTEDAGRIAGYQDYWRWMWGQGRPADETPPDAETGPEPVGPPPEGAAGPVKLHGRSFPLQAFSPRGTPESWLVRAVDAAEKSVDVAMFSFTSPEIKEALARARGRGVAVRLLFDARNAATLDVMKWFIAEGWDVRIRAGRDGRKGVLHDKFAVIDGAFTTTGSYNWTENADKNNFENVNFFDDAGSAREYGAAFRRAWEGATPPTPEELEKWARHGFNEEAGPPA